MANEIRVIAQLKVSKGGATNLANIQKDLTLAGVGNATGVQAIGTAAEQIVFPADLTTEGITWLWFYNQDASILIELFLDSGATQKFAAVPAGCPCLIGSPATNPTIYAKAASGTPWLSWAAAGT